VFSASAGLLSSAFYTKRSSLDLYIQTYQALEMTNYPNRNFTVSNLVCSGFGFDSSYQSCLVVSR